MAKVFCGLWCRRAKDYECQLDTIKLVIVEPDKNYSDIVRCCNYEPVPHSEPKSEMYEDLIDV